LGPARERVQGIQLKKFLILEACLEVALLAIQGVSNLKLRLRFQVAVRILFQELLIVLACLPLALLAERLVTKSEVVFRCLRFFLLGTAAQTEPAHAEEQ